MGIRHVHLQCSCQHPDHIIRVSLETYRGEHPQLSIQPMLNPNSSFLRRLWVAFRYVFGIKHQGDYWGSYQFEDVILDDTSVDALTTMVANRNLIVRLRKTLQKKRAMRKKKEGTRPDEEPALKAGSTRDGVGGSSPSPSAKSEEDHGTE